MPIQRKCQFTLVRGQRIGQRCDVRVPKNAATNHCRRHCPPPPVIGAPMIVPPVEAPILIDDDDDEFPPITVVHTAPVVEHTTPIEDTTNDHIIAILLSVGIENIHDFMPLLTQPPVHPIQRTCKRYNTFKKYTCSKLIQDECPVCDGTKSRLILKCKHTLCYDCLQKIHTKTCPYCREAIDYRDVCRLD